MWWCQTTQYFPLIQGEVGFQEKFITGCVNLSGLTVAMFTIAGNQELKDKSITGTNKEMGGPHKVNAPGSMTHRPTRST